MSLNVWAAPIVSPVPTAVKRTPPVLVTAFGGNEILDFVELYNQLDSPVKVDGWQVQFTVRDIANPRLEKVFIMPKLQGWLLAGGYVSYVRDGQAPTSIPFSVDAKLLADFVTPKLAKVELLSVTQESMQTISVPLEQTLEGKWAQHKQRTKATLYDTETLSKDYTFQTGIPELYSEPTYLPPGTTSGLQIVEILAEPENCAPNDPSVYCGDYIKVFNSSKQPIDLAKYRLRTGFQGQSATVATTFTWGREIDIAKDELWLPAGEYLAVSSRNDSTAVKRMPLQLTNSGGYVWLEDALGVELYTSAVVEYKAVGKGTSWAFNATTKKWQLGVPAPLGKNIFKKLIPGKGGAVALPCRVGYYRNPTTNRCRLIASSAVTIAACKPGQMRNPETNRCRNTATLSGAVVPCRPGQTRNPETNRCRNAAASASSAPTPCKAGQERNPDTNRCRKIATTAATTAAISTPKEPEQSSMIGWAIGGVVAAGALGYAVYEWRQPIVNAGRRLLGVFGKRPPAA